MGLKLSPLFSDGMVLQRSRKIKVWGVTGPKETVEVDFLGKKYRAESDDCGKWECLADEQSAGGPYIMKISDRTDSVTINDILIGDVWLCGGQSNMELMMNRVKYNYPDEFVIENPHIRQMKIPQVYNFHAPSEFLSECRWESYSPQNAENFTAAGYFFAKKLNERYNVPIGLLASAVGGTPVHAWMSGKMLEGFPEAIAEAVKCVDDDYVKSVIEEYDNYTRKFFAALDGRDEGLTQSWFSEDYDDSNPDWEEADICLPVKKTGTIWFRKKIEVPSDLQGKPAVMFLGTAVDSDIVYVNGEAVGGTGYRYPPRNYEFTLPSGTMVIAIRLSQLNGWEGGFTPGKNRFISCENRSIDIGGNWKRRQGAECEPLKPQTFFNYKPTGLFNGMIAPVSSWAIKGAIWYQGESDTGNHERYAEKFETLICGWRKLWGIGDFPFLFVQLAYYEYTGGTDWDLLREQQRRCLSVKNTGMAAAYDLGEFNDLHPQNKRDIGERLARLAMRIAYGEKLPPSPFEICNY